MRRHHRSLLGVTATTLTLALLASQGNADILHDTLAGTLTSNWLVGFSPQGTNINQPADSFVVSGGNFFFESMTLGIAGTTLPDNSGGTDYAVRLWKDSGSNTPGTMLESFTVPNSSSLSGNVVLNSALQPQLTNGSTYWVSAALPDNESQGFWRSVDILSNGRATAFSNSETTTWSPRSSGGDAFALQVTGNPVPEPASLGLLCLAAAFIGFQKKRLRKA